jgi:hypothetical protein
VDHTHTVTRSQPIAEVNRKIAALNLAFTGFFGLAGATLVKPVPEWRSYYDPKRGCRVTPRTYLDVEERETSCHYEEVEEAMDPVWHSPCQVEDGMILLSSSPTTSFTVQGTEGLSIVIDKRGRMHLVLWVTKRYAYQARSKHGDGTYTNHGRGRYVPKMPLNVHSFPIGTDPDDAISEMKAVAAAMDRTTRDGQENGLTPALSAAMDDLRDDQSVPMITGAPEWLALVVDQRSTRSTYRPRGAESDD